MKPFNLEAALRGDPVVTRSGHKVVFIAYDKEASPESRVVTRIEGCTCLNRHDCHGVFMLTSVPNAIDLFMETKKRTVWLNVYPKHSNHYGYDSKEAADVACVPGRLGNKAIPVEIEE